MKPFVTAHSGCENTEPNTAASVLTAAEAGADAAELDIRLSADHKAVLSHDDLFTAGGMARSIAASSIRDLGSITTLEEILPVAREKGIMLNLDIKDFSPGCMKEVMHLLDRHNAHMLSVFSGFSPSQVIELRKTWPSAAFMVNVSEEFVPEDVISLYGSNAGFFADTLTGIYRETGGICLNMSRDYCGLHVLETLSKRFVPVSVWTVDNADQMKEFMEAGAYAITTRKVKLLAGLIGMNFYRLTG